MDWTESKLKIKARADALNARFSELFKTIQVGPRSFFLGPDGATLFALDYLGPYGALVIEHAADYNEALANRLEDGDLFYLDDLDEDAMFKAMLQEIEE
jgi:hypothetical protein